MHVAILAALLTVQSTPPQQPVRSVAAAQAPAVEYVQPPFVLPPSLRDSVRFGWLEVPQDHGDPAAGTLRLAFAVLRARAADPAADPIVFIPGGPGMSAVEPWTADAARSPRIALLRERRDFIILDPRGHGLSQPRTCPELNGAAPLTDDSPVAEAILARKLAACRARMEAEGIRLATLNSIQAAHDIELLRRALGVEQINLFGGSYGTRIAAEALRRHASSIRAVVFLGPVPPGLPHLGDDADVAPEVFATLFRRCAQLRGCRAAYPRLDADYDSVIARTRRTPLHVPMPVSDRAPEGALRLDERMLSEALAQLLVARSLAGGVPMMIHTVAHHGFAPVLPMAPQLVRMLSDDDVAFGTHLAFHCNDSPVALEKAVWLHTRCPLWVGEGYGDRTGEPLQSDVPALIMAGEFDPRTPPSYGRHLARGLTRARILEIPWHGHDLQHPCLSRIQRDFFDAPEHTPDTACLDSLPPLRFATGVVPSRWIASATMHAAEGPLRVAAPGLAALLLLLVPVIGVPVGALRARRAGQLRRRRVDRMLLWLAATTALTLLIAALAAVVVGGRHTLLLPAIGVPTGWSWVLALPWLLLVLGAAAVVLTVRRTESGDAASVLIRLSAVAGIGLVLGMWVFLSLA